MAEYNRFIFSGTLVRSNIFRLRLKRAISDTWFAQNKFSTQVNLAISGVHFLFAIFQYLKFVRFRSYSKLKLPMDIVDNGENCLSIYFFIFEK